MSSGCCSLMSKSSYAFEPAAVVVTQALTMDPRETGMALNCACANIELVIFQKR